MSGIVFSEERSGEFGLESEIKRRLSTVVSTVEPQETRWLSVGEKLERERVEKREKVRIKREKEWILCELVSSI